jgi:hypothetical protein
LVALLVLAALSKMFSNLSPGLMVLGLIVPLYFAYAIARFDGRAYSFLILLLLLNALNILLEKEHWLGKLADLVLPAAIIAVAFVAQRKIFPNMRLFRVKKGADGSYIWVGQTEKDEAKPWQKEAMRLQSEIDALRKQDKELSPKVDEAFERWKSDSR